MRDSLHSTNILPAALFTAALGLAAWWLALGCPFLFDDLYLIVGNPVFDKPWNLVAIAEYNRPLVLAVYSFIFRLAGNSAPGFHLVSILLHIANTFLLGLLSYRLVPSLSPRLSERYRTIAAVSAGLIFLLHPFQVSAVVQVSALSEVICTTFLLLGFHSVLRLQRRQSPLGWMAPSLAFLAAILCKETAVAFLPAILLLLLLLPSREIVPDPNPGGILEWLRSRLLPPGKSRPFLLLYTHMILIALGITYKVFHFQYGGTVATGSWSAAALPFNRLEYLLTSVSVWAQGILVFFQPLPSRFCPDWPWPVSRSLLDGRVLSALAFLTMVFGAAALLTIKRNRLPLFGLSLYLLILLPVNSLFPILDPYMEYRFYLPLAGLALAVTSAAAHLVCVLPERLFRLRAALGAAMVLLPLLFAIPLEFRLYLFHDEVGLWEDAVAKSPLYPRVRANLVAALRRHHGQEKALSACERAIRECPLYYPLIRLHAEILQNIGRPQEALKDYLFLAEYHPANEDACARAASILVQLGRFPEAGSMLARVPWNARGNDYYLATALLARKIGFNSMAAGVYRYLLDTNPSNPTALLNRGNILMEEGHCRDALELFRRGIGVDPTSHLLLYAEGSALWKLGDLGGAEQSFRQARRQAPWFVQNLQALTNLLAATRRYEEATGICDDILARDPGNAEARKTRLLLRKILGEQPERDRERK